MEEQKQNREEQNMQGQDAQQENLGKKARIYNLIIVDESGSMSTLAHATVGGVNETINSIRSAQKLFADTQEHYLTLVTFDSHGEKKPVRTLIDCKPIAEVGNFEEYSPWGCTPLYDAMGQSISALYNRIKDDDDASAVVTVLSDGLENDSHEWNATGLKELIEKLKNEGWSFSYMGSMHDVKGVTVELSIDNFIEFSHDDLGAGSSWARDSSAKMSYYRRMNEEYRKGRARSKEEWLDKKRAMASDYYMARVSPDRIDSLQPDEIFVFGSNVNGFHGGGAAAAAMHRFGAVWGQGEGLQGQSYAIPTMEGYESMKAAVQRFTQFAAEHPEMRFLVTRIGCGIAGYRVSQVAPLFRDCIKLENVALPADFWQELGLTMSF